jgi:glycosyltransferase involved in cell wall biosynthesis
VKPLISIVIPTSGRASTLKHVLEGLKRQTYRNFEVVIVHKPTSDNTGEILNEYSKALKIKVVVQKDGFVTDAYNLGLKQAKGQIVAFLDDDAVPYPNWLENHLQIHENYRQVGGISGATISTIEKNGEIVQEVDDSVQRHNQKQRSYALPWARPLDGMSGYYIFIGRDGLVHHHSKVENIDSYSLIPSLLHMGANMSIKKEALEGLHVNDELILGFTFEQLLSYQIWKKGYKLLYSPSVKVLHLVHRESTGRFFQSPKRAALRDAEFILTFAFLKSQERELSWIAYILGLFALIGRRITRVSERGLIITISRVIGLLYGFVIGSAYLISKAICQSFSIRVALSRLL